MSGYRTTCAMGLALLLSACAGGPTQKDAANEMDRLEREGKLEAVFDQLVSEKPGLIPLPSFGKSRQERIVEVGGRLATAERKRLDAELEQVRLPADGVVPLVALDAIRGRADKIRRWSEPQSRQFQQRIDAEQAATRKKIDEEKAAADRLPENRVKERLAALERAGALGGKGSAEETAYQQRLNDTKQRLYQDGVRLTAEKQLDAAEAAFAALREVDAAYRDLPAQVRQLRLAQVEREYREPRSDDAVEAAYRQLLELAADPYWAEQKKNAAALLAEVRAYYQSLAAAALQESRLADCYRAVVRARAVGRLAADAAPLPEESILVEKVKAAFDAALRTNHAGLAYGQLLVIQELQPDFPQLQKLLRETRDKALESAQRKVGTNHFTAMNENAKLGAAVASKVAQILGQELRHDIRLIEREQLQAVLREQEIRAIQDRSALNIASTDFLIQGNVVEAAVEIDEKKGRKVARVKTGEKRHDNPEFRDWLTLSQAERAKRARPPETVAEPVLEDVTINVGVHRKKGMLSIAFKLVDSANAKILFTQTESFSRTAESESSDAIQLGEYVVPMKVAELPSDSEMMSALTDEAARRIATALAERLRDQDALYEKQAARYQNEDNAVMAAENTAFAVLIGEEKGRDTKALADRLRTLSLSTPAGL